jgi:hypothetical protein
MVGVKHKLQEPELKAEPPFAWHNLPWESVLAGWLLMGREK